MVYELPSVAIDIIPGSSMWYAELTGVPDATISPQGRGKHMFTSDDLIFSYTTKEAVEDGVLVKVDQKISSEASIKFPVYITDSVWKRYVEPQPGITEDPNLNTRLWDILFMFAWAAKSCNDSLLQFKFTCQVPNVCEFEPNESKSGLPFQFREVILKAIITAQDVDDPSPAIFIMKPWED